jgi:hypothetical protein
MKTITQPILSIFLFTFTICIAYVFELFPFSTIGVAKKYNTRYQVINSEATSQMVDCSLFMDSNGTFCLSIAPNATPDSVPYSFTLNQMLAYELWFEIVDELICPSTSLAIIAVCYAFAKYVLKKSDIPGETTRFYKNYYFILGLVSIVLVGEVAGCVLQLVKCYISTDLPEMFDILQEIKKTLSKQ